MMMTVAKPAEASTLHRAHTGGLNSVLKPMLSAMPGAGLADGSRTDLPVTHRQHIAG